MVMKQKKGIRQLVKGQTTDDYMISGLLPSKPGIVVVLSKDSVDKMRSNVIP